MDLTIGGKVVSALLMILSVVMVVSGGKFAYDNFTYSPPPRDDVMLALEEVVITSNFNEEDYVQTISKEEYENLSVEGLFDLYTEKGQADIRSIAQDSMITEELMLRNIGIDLKEDELLTRSLDLLSGQTVDLLDGQERLLVFVDGSPFSVNQLSLLYQYSRTNPLDYVVIFPTLTGTQVEEFYKANANNIGNPPTATRDSMSEDELMLMTQGEYKMNHLPAYVAIDSFSVVSNAGAGTVFNDQESLKTFLRRSFTDGNKLYLEIKESRELGIKQAQERVQEMTQ